MELRRQYDYFDLMDGAQALIYTIGANGNRQERGEITELTLSISRSSETVNSAGQEFPGKKAGLPECTATMTYRTGQDQSQWAKMILGPPISQQGRRRRVERFEIIAFMHDREVPHAGVQKIVLHNCWVSEASVPLVSVDTRILTGTATIQAEWAEIVGEFEELPNEPHNNTIAL
ncbi:MAG: phage tail tube protein [Defluviitaleaceae bacterium]|nr:phage tail tube protein [Defluviitaleaceae bacterium]